MKILPSLEKWLAIFAIKGRTGVSNSGLYDPKLNVLTTQPRIHNKISDADNTRT